MREEGGEGYSNGKEHSRALSWVQESDGEVHRSGNELRYRRGLGTAEART